MTEKQLRKDRKDAMLVILNAKLSDNILFHHAAESQTDKDVNVCEISFILYFNEAYFTFFVDPDEGTIHLSLL